MNQEQINKNGKSYYHCFFCNQKFQFGPSVYDGKGIAEYDIVVCTECFENNSNGWSGLNKKKLIEHLKEKGLKVPALNNLGNIPRKEDNRM